MNREITKPQQVICFLTKEDLTELLEKATERAIEKAQKVLPRFYTNEDVCKILHITTATLYNMVKRGEIRQLGVGGRTLYSADEIDNAVKQGNIRKGKHHER